MEDFLSARLTKEFEARSAFERKADDLFIAFLQRRGMTEDALLLEHETHYKTTVAEREQRVASDEELADLRAMLSTHGVAPVTDSVKKYCAQKTGRKAEGLWSFVASFRAEKKKTDKAQQKRQPKGRSTGARGEEGGADDDVEPKKLFNEDAVAEDMAAQTMVDMGFSEADITNALEPERCIGQVM